MTNPKKTTVKFLGTVDELPGALKSAGQAPAQHWVDAAEKAKGEPGIWHIISLDNFTLKAHASAASRINTSSRGTNARPIRSFSEPGFSAAFREGRLYVRYDAPAVAKLRRAQ